MARDNFSYKKRQKELARKKKQQDKLQRRLAKKNANTEESAGQVAAEDILKV